MKGVAVLQIQKLGQLLRKVSFRCAFGPEDMTLMKPLLQSGERGYLPNGQPRKRVKKVESIKRGCLSGFEAVTYEGSEGIVEIRYHRMEHVNASGKICHGLGFAEGGRASLAPSLSQEVREAVEQAVTAGEKHASIVRRIKEGFELKYQESKGLATLEEAQKALEASNPPLSATNLAISAVYDKYG